jgi:hypothetical protein
LLEHTPKVFRDNLVNRAAQILACYRKHCASPTSAGQLILPECLKLLPLYISCLLKNDAFSGGSDITLDDRSYAMYFVCTMDLPTSVSFFYPRLIPINNANAEEDGIPASIRCTIDKMTDDGAYILGNVWSILSLAWLFSKKILLLFQTMAFTCSYGSALVCRVSLHNQCLALSALSRLTPSELVCPSLIIRCRRGYVALLKQFRKKERVA